MNYEHKINKRAVKFIRSQDKAQQKRIFEAIYDLPVKGDIKMLAGRKDTFRLRVGDYRILFRLIPHGFEIIIVDVFDADNRGQVYK